MLFLWNANSSVKSREINLEFYNSSNGEIQRHTVSECWPYFLSSSPLSKDEREAVLKVEGRIELVEKRNLYTAELQEMTKVSVWTPSFLRDLTKQFDEVWEGEVDHGREYIYDSGLTFGASYIQQNDSFVPADETQTGLEGRFEEAFRLERENSPVKYALIKRWFDLCQQPVPDVDPDLLDIKEEGGDVSEQVYLAFLLSRLANIPVPEAHKSRRVSDWIKSMVHTYLRSNGVLIPTSRELRRGLETHRVVGALTLEPITGTYFNTVVCDFESLYPSCIDSFNLSYETVDCSHEDCRANKIPSVGHHICTRRKGFYSLLVGALKDLRIRWFKPLANDFSIPEEERELAKAASKLLKLMSVSSYGVTIRIHGVACPPLAESITGYGRWILQTTWNMAKDSGMTPIYGDTDSIFLDNPTSLQVNSLINRVKKRFSLDLAVERHYNICVLPKAKKAYFGITKAGVADLKGLTAIKSNAPRFIQKVFRDCVKELSKVTDVTEYNKAKGSILTIVQDAKKRLLEWDVALEDLIYSVQLYRDPQEKISSATSMSQPYQCAVQLMDQGKKLRRRDTVQFVKVKPFNYKGRTFTVKPADYVRNVVEINVEDYIRNLTTALRQTFEAMGISLESKGDTKLTKWFT
jgi:DNA polymerase elongation subunit (family B)